MGFWSWLEGRKTFISAGCGIATVIVYLFGIVDESQMLIILALFGFSGLASLRSAIKKLYES